MEPLIAITELIWGFLWLKQFETTNIFDVANKQIQNQPVWHHRQLGNKWVYIL